METNLHERGFVQIAPLPIAALAFAAALTMQPSAPEAPTPTHQGVSYTAADELHDQHELFIQSQKQRIEQQQVAAERIALIQSRQAKASRSRHELAAKKASATAVQTHVQSGIAAKLYLLSGCESGHTPTANTGNGFYGEYQFDKSTWIGIGGTKYAPRADLATHAEQTEEAAVLQAARGWQPWPACSKKLGL
jgi:hypothetical protein